MIIGLCAIILFPNINSKMIFPHIINNILTGGIIKGFAISGLLAVVMSSADSFLHSAGLLLSNDILKPIVNLKKKHINELLYVKISTIITASLAIYLAILMNRGINFRDINLMRSLIAAPILLFPVSIGILGIKSDKKSFVLSIISGLSFLSFSYHYLPLNMKTLAIPIGIISNAIVYMISHILQNKGIAWVKRTESKDGKQKKETKLWIPNPEKILNTIINSIPTPKKIYAYSRFQVMKNGSENMIFGIYCCINFTLPYFLWDHQDTEKFNLMTNLRFAGGIMAGLLIVKDQWKDFLKPYYPLYWHITLTYCLPFITTVMFLLTGGSLSWLMNIGTSIFFLIMLVPSQVFLILAPLGTAFAIIFYSICIESINLPMKFDNTYFLIYQILFPTIIGLLFSYSKKIFYLFLNKKESNLGLSLCNELKTKDSLSTINILKRRLEYLSKYFKGKNNEKGFFVSQAYYEDLQKIINKLKTNSEQSKKIIEIYKETLTNIELQLKEGTIYSMKTIVKEAINKLKINKISKENLSLEMEKDIYIKMPKMAVETIILSMLRDLEYREGITNIKIQIENNRLYIKRESYINNFKYIKTKYLEYSMVNDIVDIKE